MHDDQMNIVIVGHVDHGKTQILDTIRNADVVSGESGGITQHIGAYVAKFEDKSITFIDTPGHEAFSHMRSRGAKVADVAVLIVSVDDGVKAQTLEALSAITEAKLPYIVAINKIDRPNADVERAKTNLLENEIYLEGLGGNIPFAPISAKTGQGVPELLDLLLLAADLEELTGDPSKNAEGVVIESHVEPKKGVSATLVIKNGTLKSGMYVVVGSCYAPVRIMEDFLGKNIKEATFSAPVRVIGFNATPAVGSIFTTCANKKEAEKLTEESKTAVTAPEAQAPNGDEDGDEELTIIPIVIKTDVAGTLDAINHELEKIETDRVHVKKIQEGVGTISEGDVKNAAGSEHAIIVGFNVGLDSRAKDLAERTGVEIKTFTIIYELAEWLAEAIVARRPKIEVEEVTGAAKILKTFSRSKDKQIVGGRVTSGSLSLGAQVKIMRRENEIGRGKITNLQSQKASVKSIDEGNEFGSEIQSKIEIAEGDVIESIILTVK